jgi:hypothetical protein
MRYNNPTAPNPLPASEEGAMIAMIYIIKVDTAVIRIL